MVMISQQFSYRTTDVVVFSPGVPSAGLRWIQRLTLVDGIYQQKETVLRRLDLQQREQQGFLQSVVRIPV